MLFPDMSDPLAPPPSTIDTIANVDTGSVFRSAYHKLCTKPNDVLCSLIMYLDCIYIDQHGRCSLEPGYAMSGYLESVNQEQGQSAASIRVHS
jgi:hypothetical protein